MLYVFYQKQLKIQLIRPTLALNRVETFKLSIFWKLPTDIDYTNKLINFRRNRLRHQILPILKFFFNPKIDAAFLKFAEELNLEKNYFYQQIKENKRFLQLYKLKFKQYKCNKLKKNIFFLYLPTNLRKKIYKQILIFYLKDITYNEINCLLNLKFFKNK